MLALFVTSLYIFLYRIRLRINASILFLTNNYKYLKSFVLLVDIVSQKLTPYFGYLLLLLNFVWHFVVDKSTLFVLSDIYKIILFYGKNMNTWNIYLVYIGWGT
jgi:hypothetical protein